MPRVNTVAPRYNEDPVITNNILKAQQNNSKKYVETNPAIINEIPAHNLLRYNEYFVLSLTVRKNGMMIQMVDKPNTPPIGQDSETLTFKALLYLYVAVRAQVCGLFCVVYNSLFSLVRPAWLPRYDEYFCC